MNVRDSEIMRGSLEEAGYLIVGKPEDADIVIFNTCSVREHAEHRAISALGAIARKKPRRIFGLTGCVAEHRKESLFKSIKNLDFICGPQRIYEIAGLIERARNGEKTVGAFNDGVLHDAPPVWPRDKASSGFVKISEGCSNFCSYCIVPYVRGRQRNRSGESILDEIKKLADSGHKEVMLLGQNVNSYNGFVRLLEDVNKIDGIERIRFMTSHPKDATDDLFKAMRDLDKVCKHLHLPLQSGSNKILKRMDRGYTSEKYLKLTDNYRKIVSSSTLTTDIIVGFPGECEEDFEDTCSMMKNIRFNGAFIFKYSPRPPAKSSEFKDDVTREAKKERNQILLELQKDISHRIKKGLI